MAIYPSPTTGVGIAAKVAVDSSAVVLSLSGAITHQITTNIEDLSGAVTPGVSLVLSAAALASGGTTAYTGTITTGGINALVGSTFVVSGFDLVANNGTFVCTASTTTTLTLDNAVGVLDTHAATAVEEGAHVSLFVSRSTHVATVSSSGLITGVAKGRAVVEVGYPTFDNNHGNAADGLPAEKIYSEINVTVTA